MPSKKNTTGSEIARLDMEDKGNTLSRRAVLQKGAKLAAAAAVPSLVGLGSLTTSTPASAWGPIKKWRAIKSELPVYIQDIISNGTESDWNYYEILWKYDSANTGHVFVTQNIIRRFDVPDYGPIDQTLDTWTMSFYEKTGELADKSIKTLDLTDTKEITFTHNGGSDITLKSESDRRSLQGFHFMASMKWLQTYMFYLRQGFIPKKPIYSGIIDQGLAYIQYSLRHPRTGSTRIMYLYGTRTLENGKRVDNYYEALDEPSGMAGPSASLRIIADKMVEFAGVECMNIAGCFNAVVSTTLGANWFAVAGDLRSALVWTASGINNVAGLIPSYFQNLANNRANNMDLNTASNSAVSQLRTMENQNYLREVTAVNTFGDYVGNEWYQTQIRPPRSWYPANSLVPIMPADWRTPTPSPGYGLNVPADNEWGIQPGPTSIPPTIILDTENPTFFYTFLEDRNYVPPNYLNGPRLANVEL